MKPGDVVTFQLFNGSEFARRYRFVDELPRTATGKKMHYLIRQRLGDEVERETLQHP